MDTQWSGPIETVLVSTHGYDTDCYGVCNCHICFSCTCICLSCTGIYV